MRRALLLAACVAAALIRADAAFAASNQLSCAAQLDAAIRSSARRPPDPELFVQFYRCLGLSEWQSQALARLRVQLAGVAQAYMAGKIAAPDYQAFLIDRQRKAKLIRESDVYAADIVRGDEDGDFVPDSADKCPGTAVASATDQYGCPIRCPQPGAPAGGADPICQAWTAPYRAEDPLRPLLEASVPINLACEDTAPAAIAPIAWGDRNITVNGGGSDPHSSTTDSDNGYYFSVRRTSRQVDGCEVWYVLQFAFRNPSTASVPATELVSVLFSSRDDETRGDPSVARFRMMIQHNRRVGDLVTFTNLPLSDGRTRLRDALKVYRSVSIRARVITGAQQTSPWSAFVLKPKGARVAECSGPGASAC